MTVEAVQTDLMMNDVPESEVWDIAEFRNYKVRLVNNGGQTKMVLSVKLDAPAPCRLVASDLDFACRASADCLPQHLQVI